MGILSNIVNEAERWKQTSMSPAEAIEKYGKENVKVKKGALRNGDDMVEVYVESMNEGGMSDIDAEAQEFVRGAIENAKYIQQDNYYFSDSTYYEFTDGLDTDNEALMDHPLVQDTLRSLPHVDMDDEEIKQAVDALANMQMEEAQLDEFGPDERYTRIGSTTNIANAKTGSVSSTLKIGGDKYATVNNHLNRDGSAGKMAASGTMHGMKMKATNQVNGKNPKLSVNGVNVPVNASKKPKVREEDASSPVFKVMMKSLLRSKWYLENEEMDPGMVASELSDVNDMINAVEDGISEMWQVGLDTSVDEQYMSLYREAVAKLKGEETSIYGVDNNILPPNAEPNPDSPYNSGQTDESVKKDESYSPGDEMEDGMVSNCCGAPIMDVYDGHGRCSDCKEMASAEKEEAYYESAEIRRLKDLIRY